jgi:hypothetical protein
VRPLLIVLAALALTACESRPRAHALLLELPPQYHGLVRVIMDERAPMPEVQGDDWVVTVPRTGSVRLHPLPSDSGWRGVRCEWRGGGPIPDGDPTSTDAVGVWQLGQVVHAGEATSSHDLLIGTRLERDAARASPEGYELGDVAALRRYHALAGIGRSALHVGDATAAAAAGHELLALAGEFRGWDYGNAVHDGNEILGLAALRSDDVAAAKQALRAAGATPGSDRLAAEGPDLRLAHELLERGEREAVLAYLDDCARFWRAGAERIASWKDAIRSGIDPEFTAKPIR